MATPIETFPALSAIPGFSHGFLTRDPEVDTATTNRQEVLARLESSHRAAWKSLGFKSIATVDQVHGDTVLVAGSDGSEADGLITSEALALGIYVADCCAVFLVDPVRRVHSLVHSGRKGSELGIAPGAIARMVSDFGSNPADIVVQLSPCIRPPLYEIDFAAMIRESCQSAGVPREQIHDPLTCTGTHLERYYSYRVEKGATGRMLAVSGYVG